MAVLELTKDELYHLQNDTITYIWKIKERVFGDSWNFGIYITEVDKLTEEQKKELEESGYYSRLALLEKLDAFERKYFQSCDCGE